MRVKYKNELYQIIRENNLEPYDFEISEKEIEKFPGTILNFKDSPFKFIIRNAVDSFELFDCQYTVYGPGFELSSLYPPVIFTDFEYVANIFEDWLNSTLYEYLSDQKEIDLWTQLESNTKSLDINSIDFENKERFLNEEKKQVKLAVNELKLLIDQRFNLNEREQKIVNDRLDYIIDATERLNKYDWKSLVISTLISISVALSFDTEKGKILFELFRKVFLQIQNIGQ